MQHEHAVLVDLNQLGEFGEVLLDVDLTHRVIAEHEEEPIESEIDRGGLDAGLVQRVDDDAPGCEFFADRVVGEDHERRRYSPDQWRRPNREIQAVAGPESGMPGMPCM